MAIGMFNDPQRLQLRTLVTFNEFELRDAERNIMQQTIDAAATDLAKQFIEQKGAEILAGINPQRITELIVAELMKHVIKKLIADK